MNDRLVFTLDLEEWFHSQNIAPYWQGQHGDHSSLYIIEEVLSFLAERSIKGTFFVLGTIAQAHPELIKLIHKEGHEIASHGWDHRLLNTLDRRSMLDDVKRSTSILEDLVSEKIVGYRSPCFSKSDHLLEALLENGYLYTSNGISSSIHDRYRDNSIKHIEMHDFGLPVAKMRKFSVPATGGGWFRLFPLLLQKTLLQRTDEFPKVFYIHAIDFDHKLPELDFVPYLMRVRQTINSFNSFDKLKKLDFHNQPLKSFLY